MVIPLDCFPCLAATAFSYFPSFRFIAFPSPIFNFSIAMRNFGAKQWSLELTLMFKVEHWWGQWLHIYKTIRDASTVGTKNQKLSITSSQHRLGHETVNHWSESHHILNFYARLTVPRSIIFTRRSQAYIWEAINSSFAFIKAHRCCIATIGLMLRVKLKSGVFQI